MDVFVLVAIIACLVIVFIQDWKFRQIHFLLPLFIFILSIIYVKQYNLFFFKNLLVNIIFLSLTLSVLVLYMSIKNKTFLNPFQNYFGIGDFLFYIAIAPLFILNGYLFFFILSMLFAVGMQFSFKKILTSNSVPLAGYTAILLIFIIIKDYLFDFNKITLI